MTRTNRQGQTDKDKQTRQDKAKQTRTANKDNKQRTTDKEQKNEKERKEDAGVCVCVCVNKSENTGITSVDRSTKATLSTYNPWIQVSRLQKIYHFQHKKFIFTKLTLTFNWFTRTRAET
jgi:hypothetical protein